MKHAEKNKQTGKKIRKLYHLDREDVEFIREYANQKEISESEVIRLSVRKMQKDTGSDPFLKLIGTVDVGLNGAINHDEIIYE